MQASRTAPRCTLLFDIEPFADVHLGKDVGLFPLYMKLMLGMESRIVHFRSPENAGLRRRAADFPVGLRGVPRILRFLPERFPFTVLKNASMFLCLARLARETDLLMLFHAKKINLLYLRLYRILNPRGMAWIKLDMESTTSVKSGKIDIRRYVRAADLVSAESGQIRDALNAIIDRRGDRGCGKRVALVPNGFDDLRHPAAPIARGGFKPRRNVFLTVGRLGTRQKNSELILEAIGLVRDKSAEFWFVGPTTREFEEAVNRFRAAHPDAADRIRLFGNVAGKSRLYELYASSKCFILSSRWESFGLVLIEAQAHGDYILCTDLPASRDIVGTDEGIGKLFPQEDAEALGGEIDRICAATIDSDRIARHGERYYQSAITAALGRELGLAPATGGTR